MYWQGEEAMRRPIRLGITTVGMICYSSFAVTAQQTAPTDNRGAHTDVLAVIDLLTGCGKTPCKFFHRFDVP
jgi:hypothetical protein